MRDAMKQCKCLVWITLTVTVFSRPIFSGDDDTFRNYHSGTDSLNVASESADTLHKQPEVCADTQKTFSSLTVAFSGIIAKAPTFGISLGMGKRIGRNYLGINGMAAIGRDSDHQVTFSKFGPVGIIEYPVTLHNSRFMGGGGILYRFSVVSIKDAEVEVGLIAGCWVIYSALISDDLEINTMLKTRGLRNQIFYQLYGPNVSFRFQQSSLFAWFVETTGLCNFSRFVIQCNLGLEFLKQRE
jgi:hypothetical protein